MEKKKIPGTTSSCCGANSYELIDGYDLVYVCSQCEKELVKYKTATKELEECPF